MDVSRRILWTFKAVRRRTCRDPQAAYNYAVYLSDLQRHEEARSLLRKTMPVARRVLGENTEATLRMRLHYEKVLYLDAGATLDDLREAVTTLEERNGPRGVCSVPRTRPQWTSRATT